MTRKPAANDASPSPVPDDRRCSRKGGGGWRCRSESHPGFRYCSHHLRLGRRAQAPNDCLPTRTATDGVSAEDPDTVEEPLLRRKNEKGEKVVMAALSKVAKKKRGIVTSNLTPKGILLGLTKKMSLLDPIYILVKEKVMVQIRFSKGKTGISFKAYKFCGRTEDEAALAAIDFLQCVLIEISHISLTEMENCHGEVEKMKVESAEASIVGKQVNFFSDREEVLLVKCKGIIDSAIEDMEDRQGVKFDLRMKAMFS